MKTWFMAALFCAACVAADGDDATCTTKDFRGIYAFHAKGVNVMNNVPLTFAGTLTADGEGKITAWKDWAATATAPPPGGAKVVTPLRDIYAQAQSLGHEILYTVEPDCLITITTVAMGPTGPTPIVQVGALAAGGDEALLMNGAAESPYVTLVTMKRAGGKNEGKQ